MTSWLFLIAYACSGLAGLIYEVTWTRLLTLYVGHTIAAASTVVAAFLAGLAIGAAAGGRLASRVSARRSLQAYVGLELAVALCALLLPLELRLFAPALSSAYQDGNGGALFTIMRILSCSVMVLIPALALGATFPMAIRWFARRSDEPAAQSSTLYFVNTAGAAVGALLAGFVLIPSIGMSGSVYVAMAASAMAASCVGAVLLLSADEDQTVVERQAPRKPSPQAEGAFACAAVAGDRRPRIVRVCRPRPRDRLDADPVARAGADHLCVCRDPGGSDHRRRNGFRRRAGCGRPARDVRRLAGLDARGRGDYASWTYSFAGTRLPLWWRSNGAAFAAFDHCCARRAPVTAR